MNPIKANRPGFAVRAAEEKRPGQGLSDARIPLDLDHFRARVLQDALTEATAGYWIRRAQHFEDAAPKPGDWHGLAEADDLVDRAIRCRQIAENCRHHAQLLLDSRPEPIGADIWALVEEVA